MVQKPLTGIEPVYNEVIETLSEEAIQCANASNGNEHLVFGVSVWFIHYDHNILWCDRY